MLVTAILSPDPQGGFTALIPMKLSGASLEHFPAG